MKTLNILSAALITLSAASAFAGNCQHPYCETSSGFDQEHGYNGDLSPAEPAEAPVTAADAQKAELAKVGVERYTAPDYKPGLVRHVVLFRYAPGVTPEQKQQVATRFLALRNESLHNGRRVVVSIETGGEISGEGADQGLEQGFIVTFKSQGDRNYYVGQPVVTDANNYDAAHQAFKDFVGPLLAQTATGGALVFDFAVEQAARGR